VPAVTLHGVAVTVARGHIVAVVGGTGEGKSSLLAAILGDLPALQPERGSLVRGSVAYCAQQSWIFSGTVRENILFGRPFDSRKYREALRAADLEADLDQMGGDDTELGERGVNVSGGQKQRISLARAFYADSDIYILDDVLSALDAAVAARIFERYLEQGLRARGKTVIFATNRLEFVSACDEVIVLSAGAVHASGPVGQVRQSSHLFATLMASTEEEGAGADTDALPDQGAEGTLAGAPAPASAELAPQAAAGGTGDEPEDTSRVGGLATSAARTLVAAEHRDKGQLSSAVVLAYLRAAGGLWASLGVVLLFGTKTGCDYAANWWLSVWSAHNGEAEAAARGSGGSWLDGDHGTAWWLSGYLLAQLAGVCATLASQLSLAMGGLRASRHLAARLASSLLSAPTSFFHANPTGRLINVATKDQRDVDQVLVTNLAITLMISMSLLATLCVVVASIWWTIILIVPLVAFFLRTRNIFQKSLIEIKRWGAVTRSPVYVLFAQSLDGLFTIRAYGASGHVLGRMGALVDANVRWDLAEQASARWLSMRLGWVGGMVTLACALGGVALRDTLGAASTGLMLSYALSLSFSLIMVTRLTSQTENNFNAVERVLHYGSTLPEAGGLTAGTAPPQQWPTEGRVEFEHVSVRYRPDLPNVLSDLSFRIDARAKVGIVGRTGAGKSSLVSALFRLVQPTEGAILIDGVDVLHMSLHSLRRALGIIPQEPVLLSGSIRYNLDPFGEASDVELWQALRQAHLADHVASLPARLEAEVAEGGSNFSIGQRQLLCMARALARRCHILVMDEATAAVDSETDRLIQISLRAAFRHATVLTIAHRLHTVIDSTQVMLLAQGRLVELGPPHDLLSDQTSAFSHLVDATGEASAAALRAAAEAAVPKAAGAADGTGDDPVARFEAVRQCVGEDAQQCPGNSPALAAVPGGSVPAPFGKQKSFRQAGMAALAAVRFASAPAVPQRQPVEVGASGEDGGAASPAPISIGEAILRDGARTTPGRDRVPAALASIDAVRTSLDQVAFAVRDGTRGTMHATLAAEHVAPSEWYAELAATLHALAKEAERAREEVGDEVDTEHVPFARQDSTVLHSIT